MWVKGGENNLSALSPNSVCETALSRKVLGFMSILTDIQSERFSHISGL